MEADGMDDEALWRPSRAGDGEAFGLLFDRHRDRVFRHACRLVQTRHDAEDVTAATFLELWRRRGDVRLVRGSVLPWLLVTTSHVGRNARRATRRYQQFLARLPREDAAPDAADVALGARALGVDDELREALRGLSEPDLHLVSLVVLEDYSLADAAALLGLTAASAKSRLHRARHRMRGELTGATGTPERRVTTGGEA
jgi:RNA polymerase sigma-70 factor (ECF subfamily)